MGLKIKILIDYKMGVDLDKEQQALEDQCAESHRIRNENVDSRNNEEN